MKSVIHTGSRTRCAIRGSCTPSSGVKPAPAPVRPWREVKSRRGAPKRVNTEGFACPNQQCPYSGIIDAHIHALVGDGKLGHAERIQTFRGPACRTTFTARRDTPWYRLKTPSLQIAMVLSALGSWAGCFRRRTGLRLPPGHHHQPFYLAAFEHAQTLHERSFCKLQIPHLQLDELRTRLRSSQQVLWLWLAINPSRSLFPCSIWVPAHNMRRTCSSTPCDRSWPPFCFPLFTSDGLNVYFYALTAHFGHWLEVGRRGRKVREWQVAAELIYGQVKKSYRRRKLLRVTHVMRLGTQTDLTVALQRMGFTGRLNTAFLERVNLTVRHGVAALARRTWATAKPAPQLLAHLEWWRAYSHFVRPHAALRLALVQPRERGGKLVAQRYRQRTEALAVGRSNRPWSTREVLCYPLPPLPCCTM